MLKDDYNHLLKLFQNVDKANPPNLDAIFAQSLEFFNHLNAQMATGTPEEKQEALKIMSDLQAQMLAATKKITENAGLTEEQVTAYSENPSNFTPEQWQAIQESKSKITAAGQDLMKVIEDLNKGASPDASKQEKKPHSDGKKTKKSRWMRS